MEKKRYLIKFYYIGSTKYFGSQRQIGHDTIEKKITKSLFEKNYLNDIKSAGFEVASRTDRFVSARGACFSFLTEKTPILMEINSILPRDIGLWAFCEVDKNFSSRFNALIRHYKYIFPFPNQNTQSESYNSNLMKKACKKLVGRHDFFNFSKREKKKVNTTRDLLLADFRIENKFIIFEFKSRAFLRQQIRRMVAKILEVGREDLSINEFINLFNTEEYISYQPANPEGLILWNVEYGEHIQFIIDNKSYHRMLQYFSQKYVKYSTRQKLFDILQHNDIS